MALFNTANDKGVDTCRVAFEDLGVVKPGTTKCRTTDVWSASRSEDGLATESGDGEISSNGDGEISARVQSTDVVLFELAECA